MGSLTDRSTRAAGHVERRAQRQDSSDGLRAVMSTYISRRSAFELEKLQWPNAEASRFVMAGGLEWHVQEFGSGPVLLLLHGTGAATHSWRDVAPLLAERFRVICPDLPGHGFTSAPAFTGYSLPAMAASLGELLRALGAAPTAVAGHSAGAAILVRMALDGAVSPKVILSINGALLPLRGFPRWIFSPLANLLARSFLVPKIVAHRAADTSSITRLIDNTGSRLDAESIRLYQQLVRRPGHVSAALSMMANWDLEALARDIPRLRVPLKLLTASGDRTIPPGDAQRVRSLLPAAQIVSLGNLGHLAHEERPQRVADEILRLTSQVGSWPAMKGL